MGEEMDWNAIGAMGEILGAIAVVATLGYLAVQTRHSVAATQASTRQAILQSDQQFLVYLMSDPEMEEIRFGQDLSDVEKAKLNYFYICFVRMRENNWLQFQSGGLDRDTWESYRDSIPSVMNNPNGRNWWRNYAKARALYSAGFSREVDEILDQSGILYESASLTVFDDE